MKLSELYEEHRLLTGWHQNAVKENRQGRDNDEALADLESILQDLESDIARKEAQGGRLLSEL